MATLLLWMISFKTRSSAPSRDQQQLADTRNVLAQCTQVLEEIKCRLLKSSKQKAFENVRINSTTLLFLQARQSSSPDYRTSSHHPHLSGCSSTVLDVLPQVHVLKPSRTTWAPDHKPHTTGVCLHWPNLLSVWRQCQNNIHGTRK